MCEKYAFSHMSGGSCRNQVNRGPPWWWSYWEMQKERNETLGTSLSPYSWRHLHKGFSWIKTLLCPRMMDQLSSKVERCMLTKPSSPEPHTVNFHRRATAENKIPPTLKVRKGKPHINLEIASQGIWAQCPALTPLLVHTTHIHTQCIQHMHNTKQKQHIKHIQQTIYTTHTAHNTHTPHHTYITQHIHPTVHNTHNTYNIHTTHITHKTEKHTTQSIYNRQHNTKYTQHTHNNREHTQYTYTHFWAIQWEEAK